MYRADATPRTRGEDFTNSSGLLAQDSQPTIVFVGSSVVFSDRLMRLVDFEFEGTQVIRLRDASEVRDLDRQSRHAIRLMIVDEAATRLLSDASAPLASSAPDAITVLAYRDNAIARDMFAQRATLRTGRDLRFLPMKAPIDAWLATLRLLYLGESLVPAELIEASVVPETGKTPAPPLAIAEAPPEESADPGDQPKLTNREFQILEMVAQGQRNKSIACDLSLSEHTVKLHLHHIFGKLGVRNRTSASNWYHVRHGRRAEAAQQRR